MEEEDDAVLCHAQEVLLGIEGNTITSIGVW
jgi:hypothetical protein